ncbi:MAG TPA: hypothetical protein VLE27_04785 [Thermoanaerobaculia bacterium]|nr:hypothetical protein [Thermoanaerobaculia bacterium]
MLFPELVAPAADIRTLPPVALGFLALAFLLLFQFELVLGLWLLVKGVRTDRESAARS